VQLTVNQLVAGSSPALGAMNINIDHLIGRTVQLVETTDDYTHLKPGALGVIHFIDSTGTVFVNWHDGSKLGMILGIDLWRLVL